MVCSVSQMWQRGVNAASSRCSGRMACTATQILNSLIRQSDIVMISSSPARVGALKKWQMQPIGSLLRARLSVEPFAQFYAHGRASCCHPPHLLFSRSCIRWGSAPGLLLLPAALLLNHAHRKMEGRAMNMPYTFIVKSSKALVPFLAIDIALISTGDDAWYPPGPAVFSAMGAHPSRAKTCNLVVVDQNPRRQPAPRQAAGRKRC